MSTSGRCGLGSPPARSLVEYRGPKASPAAWCPECTRNACVNTAIPRRAPPIAMDAPMPSPMSCWHTIQTAAKRTTANITVRDDKSLLTRHTPGLVRPMQLPLNENYPRTTNMNPRRGQVKISSNQPRRADDRLTCEPWSTPVHRFPARGVAARKRNPAEGPTQCEEGEWRERAQRAGEEAGRPTPRSTLVSRPTRQSTT